MNVRELNQNLMKHSMTNQVALCTDTHFGVRKGSQVFHDYFEKFYSETFFPTLVENNIKTVIHLGDCFDVRKGIDYWSLDWSKRVFFDPLRELGINLIMIVGNHDCFYKTSLKINSPRLNLSYYENITVIDSPQTVDVEGDRVFMVPWICDDNAEQFVSELETSNAPGCMGHLELAGFYANKDYQCQHGTDPKNFSRFDYVFSGHFHKKSSNQNVTYLGNTYQMYWNDEGETRGFHLFDLKSQELEFIANPTNMFHKIYYDEDKKQSIDPTKYENTFIKLIVDGKSTPNKLYKLIDSLYDVGIHDLKVIKNMDITLDDDIEVEVEDTLTTLTNYVTSMEDNFDKENIINIFKSLYLEAQEV